MPLRLSIVSYLNSVPFLNGLRRIFSEEELTISLDIPSECAEKLKRGEVEIGLIPVAALPSIPGAVVFSDYCIACDGEVGSVLLFSDKPVQEIRTVLLDYQSRTSVRLVKLLLEHHWKKAVEYLPSSPGYEEQIKGDVAGVVIGDRALAMSDRFAYSYDLGTAWKEMTGLPFVFATWVTNRPLDAAFIQKFNEALQNGLDMRRHLSEAHATESLSADALFGYWKKSIRYEFGQKEKAGLEDFLQRIV